MSGNSLGDRMRGSTTQPLESPSALQRTVQAVPIGRLNGLECRMEREKTHAEINAFATAAAKSSETSSCARCPHQTSTSVDIETWPRKALIRVVERDRRDLVDAVRPQACGDGCMDPIGIDPGDGGFCFSWRYSFQIGHSHRFGPDLHNRCFRDYMADPADFKIRASRLLHFAGLPVVPGEVRDRGQNDRVASAEACGDKAAPSQPPGLRRAARALARQRATQDSGSNCVLKVHGRVHREPSIASGWSTPSAQNTIGPR